jgi:hypothetical protein
MEQFYEKMQ